jgi:hypothetical protein
VFLYRIEVTYADRTRAEVVVLQEAEEKAFRSAQVQIEHNYLPAKQVAEMVIIEKKAAGAGRGYVIDL